MDIYFLTQQYIRMSNAPNILCPRYKEHLEVWSCLSAAIEAGSKESFLKVWNSL